MEGVSSTLSNSATDSRCITHARQCIIVCSREGWDGELDHLNVATVAVECTVDCENVFDDGRVSIRPPV